MATRENRGDARRAGRLRRRADVHRLCGTVGLFAGAAYAAAAVAGWTGPVVAVRWAALANLATCGFVVVLAPRTSRTRQRNVPLDVACTVLTMAALFAWIAAGVARDWLPALAPALIVANWIRGGAVSGLTAWASASSFTFLSTVVVGPLDRTALTSAAGLTVVFTAAALLGWELTRVAPRGAPKDEGSPREQAPGDIVAGKYRLLRLIGQGSTGRVFEAIRMADDGRVALKLLHPQLARHPELVARFRRETEIASRLPAERIAAVLDQGSAPSHVEYIVTELLHGEDLGERLARTGALSCGEALQLVEQVASVLDAAAAAGVVHRDVQPRNVFLVHREDGGLDARLIDFGSCRIEGGSGVATHAGAILGTPGFLAPEQVSPAFGAVGAHTDVFALGCVAYLALGGRKAFAASEPARGVYEVLNHRPGPLSAYLPHIPEAVDCVLSLAIARQPADRYATAGDFARDLRAALEGELSTRTTRRAFALRASPSTRTETLAT